MVGTTNITIDRVRITPGLLEGAEMPLDVEKFLEIVAKNVEHSAHYDSDYFKRYTDKESFKFNDRLLMIHDDDDSKGFSLMAAGC